MESIMLELPGSVAMACHEFDCAGCAVHVFSYGEDPGDPPLCGMCREVGPHNKRLLDAWQDGAITADEFKEQWRDDQERVNKS